MRLLCDLRAFVISINKLFSGRFSIPVNGKTVIGHIPQTDKQAIYWSAVDWENYAIIVKKVIREYFQKPNYFKIDGQPVFAIYRIYERAATSPNGIFMKLHAGETFYSRG